jgi:shikimate dehydrogenase
LENKLPDIPDYIFESCDYVYDMVYQNKPTVFMLKAQSCGVANTIDGLGMLVEQAAQSFYLWFDVMPDTSPVRKYLRHQMTA